MLQEVVEENVHLTKREKQKRLLYLLREKKIRLGSADLYFFAKYVLGYKDMEEQPHRELCGSVQTERYKRKLILEPRGSFKSTVTTVAYSILRIIRDPNIRILIDSEDVTNAKKFLSEIKMQFETNPELVKLFGNYHNSAVKWSESEIQMERTRIAKEPTISTSGIETPRVGMHYDLMIEDDLHSNLNTKTPEQIAKVIDHWKLNQSLLDPGCEEIVIGTRWNMGDLYGEILEQEKEIRKNGGRKFRIHIRAAIYSDGRLHFPTRLTHEFLQEKRIELGSALFSSQYLNNPLDEERLLFKPSWIRFYGHYAPQNLNVTTTLDPAISERDDACNTACVTCGSDVDGYMYILEAWKKKADPGKILDEMFETQKRMQPTEFGVETVAFQKTLKFWIWERSRLTGEWIPFKELKTDTRVTKDMRIKALIPYLEAGVIMFPGIGPQSLTGDMYALYEELTQYPVGKTCDLVDALAYQLQLKAPARPLAKKPEPDDTLEAYMRMMERDMVDKEDDGLPIIGRRTVGSGRHFPVVVKHGA